MNRSANLVLVEGSDDLHFVLHLLYRNGFERAELIPGERWAILRSETGNRVEFKVKDGFEKLAAELRLELTPTYLERLAVIVDSDTDPSARWQAVATAIARAGLAAPSDIDRSGAVVKRTGSPVVGAWLMPDNFHPGYLEHLLADMIDEGDKLWPHAVTCVQGLSRVEQRFPSVRLRKAEVHTWLAWQESPGARLSEAVVRQYVKANCDAAQSFVDWFNRWLTTSSDGAGV